MQRKVAQSERGTHAVQRACHHPRAAADEARRQEKRRLRRLGLPDRADRRARRRRFSSRSAIPSASISGAIPIRSRSRSTRSWSAARRCGAAPTRALLSCDVPFGPVQEGVDSALRAAIRLVKEGGADMVKVDAAAEFPEAVKALTRAGIPVFAQFGLTPQTAMKYGIPYSSQNSAAAQATAEATAKLVEEAKMLEDAGAVALDFTNSGPVAGAAVVKAVKIPVIGGFGGGPWLDGRVRWRTPPSATRRNGSTPRPTPISTAPRPRSTPSRTLIDDARAGTPDQGLESAHGHRNHRRHHDALRGDRRRAAAPDVRAGRFQRDDRDLDALRASTPRSSCSITCRRNTPASCSTAANAASPAAASSA